MALVFSLKPEKGCQHGGQDSCVASVSSWLHAHGRLRKRRGDYHSAFDLLCNGGFPDTLIEVCREGFRKSGDNLCAFLPFVWREAEQATRRVESDLLPPEELIGEVPCWAYDMHTREGNTAMSRFLKMDCETARWIEAKMPASSRRKFLGYILFCVESGLVTNRLRWTVGDDLRHLADYHCHGVDPSGAAKIMELLHLDLPILNEARRHVVTM